MFAPLTRNMTCGAALKTGKVKVTRSTGGGRTPGGLNVTQRSVTRRAAAPGRARQARPVFAQPQQHQIELGPGNADAEKRLQRGSILLGRLLRTGAVGRHGEDMIRRDWGLLQEYMADHLVKVAAIVVLRHETLVAEKQKGMRPKIVLLHALCAPLAVLYARREALRHAERDEYGSLPAAG